MIKKLSMLFFVMTLASMTFGLVEQVADMNSFEPAFKNMQNALNPDVKAKFEMICDKLMTPDMFLPEYFTEENMKNEIVMMFGGAAPDMTEDAALFFLGYRLWERHNGINCIGAVGSPKNALGAVKSPAGAAKSPAGAVPSAQVQQMAQGEKNFLALEGNIKNLTSVAYQRMKLNLNSGKRIRTNE
jgi:hypothetical protein